MENWGGRGSGQAGSRPQGLTPHPHPPHPPTLTEFWVGWIGEEDKAGAGGYSPSSHHRIYQLRVKGHVSRPDRVTGIVAAEDNSAVAVVVVLVAGVDDD